MTDLKEDSAPWTEAESLTANVSGADSSTDVPASGARRGPSKPPAGLAHGLALAERGYHVFPARLVPKSDGGFSKPPQQGVMWTREATRDPAQIRRWASNWPGTYWGINCGDSGVVVADGDPGSTPELYGIDPHGPNTYATQRGLHVAFREPAGAVVGCGNADTHGMPHIDIKGLGGYVIAWGLPPAVSDLPELPEAVVSRMRDHAGRAQRGVQPAAAPVHVEPFAPVDEHNGEWTRDQARVEIAKLLDKVRTAPDGAVNTTLNNSSLRIGRFVGSGTVKRDWAEAALRDALLTSGRGWSELNSDDRGTIRSGLDAGIRQPFVITEDGASDGTAGEMSDVDRDEAEIEREARKLRIRALARERHEAERHAAGWAPPEDFGSLADELLLPTPEQTFRIQGLLPSQGNATLTAQFKAGKTTTVGNVTRCLADGEALFGQYPVIAPDGGIAIFNYEVDKDRFRSWLRDMNIKNTDRVFSLHLRGKSMPLSSPHVRAWVTAWLKSREIKVWILDPYSSAMLGSIDNENDNTQVSIFTGYLDAIKAEAGVSELIMPIHTGRAIQEAGMEHGRGATRIDDWPDARWILTRDDSGNRFFRADGRDVDQPERRLTYDPASRRLAIPDVSTPSDRKAIKAVEHSDRVLGIIRECPEGISGNRIMERLGVTNRPALKNAVSHLIRIGVVRTADGPNRTTLHFPVNRSDPDNSGDEW